MGDQGAENDILRKMEKRIKKRLKKGNTTEKSAMGLSEIENFGRNEATGHDQRSQIEYITEMSRNHRRNKEKNVNKEVKNAELVDMEKDSSVYGEDGSGDARNQEKRKKKKSKNKVGKLEAIEVLEKTVKKVNKEVKIAELVDMEKDSSVYGEDGGGDARNQEKIKKKKSKNKVGKLEAIEVLEKTVEEKVSKLKSGKAAKKERKKQKLMEIHDDGDIEKEYEDREQGGTFADPIEGGVTEKVKEKKRKRGRTNSKDDYCLESQGNCVGAMKSKIYDGSEEYMMMENARNSKKMYESITEDVNDDFSKKVKRKKKKAVDDEHNEGQLSALQQNILLTNHDGDVEKHKRKKKKNKTYGNKVEEANKGKNDLDEPTPSKSNKKVSFSGQVEVFPLSDDSNTKEICDEENLVQGKRFTPEENEIVKQAVHRFIQDHDLGEDGLDMVLNSRKHPELRGCWKEIGAAIPYRPYVAVYCRAQVIFRRSASRKWTQKEYDMVRSYQELHGNEWKALADELGKHRWHVKDTWRRIKLRNMNKGQWSQKEYQNLFDLVNTDLQHKLAEEKRSKHGMLRDNICWTAISDKLATRAQANCCIKWYKQLTSPMVAEGLWADTDDYRMLQKLYGMDVGCMEDVDWDTLLDHRSGDLCRKRWNQMVLHIGNYGTKPFSEHVDVLAQRYCPELLEAREIWDNKPRVP